MPGKLLSTLPANFRLSFGQASVHGSDHGSGHGPGQAADEIF